MEGKDERDEHEARKKQARLGGKEGDGSDEAHSLALTSRSPRLRCMGKSTHLVHLHALVHLKLLPPAVHSRIFLASKARLLCMALLLPIASHCSPTSSSPIGPATTPSRTHTRTRTILRPSPWISLGSPLPLFLPRNGSGSDLHEAGVTRHGDTKHAHFRICSRASARASVACVSLAGEERAHVVEKAKLRARWRPARGVRRGVAQIRVDTTRGR